MNFRLSDKQWKLVTTELLGWDWYWKCAHKHYSSEYFLYNNQLTLSNRKTWVSKAVERKKVWFLNPCIYQVLNMMTMKITFLWEVTLCSLAYRNRRFWETCCLCLRDARETLKSFCFKKLLIDRVGYININLQLLPPLLSCLGKWLQHVQKMDTNRIPKQALQYKPKGRRNIGRLKKRWREQLHFENQGTGNTPNTS
jgi:hypothetical protein